MQSDHVRGQSEARWQAVGAATGVKLRCYGTRSWSRCVLNAQFLVQPVASLVLEHQESAAAAHLAELAQTVDHKSSLQLGFYPPSGKADAMCIVVEDTGNSPPNVLVSACMEILRAGHYVV